MSNPRPYKVSSPDRVRPASNPTNQSQARTAKVGSGELRPFEKGSTHSTSIGGSTNKEHVREGMYPNVDIIKASKNVTESVPFKTGPDGPGINSGDTHNPTIPAFRERTDSGIVTEGYKPFSNKRFDGA